MEPMLLLTELRDMYIRFQPGSMPGSFGKAGVIQYVLNWREKPLRLITQLKPVRYVLGGIWLVFIVYQFGAIARWLKAQPFYLTENYISVDNWAKAVFMVAWCCCH
ncbi:hypothetical protein PSAB_08000 [Paenibacillus sabinae T27]|uniref:Uncharacterized protein n=1 Tax=Paenibacillus sabinae T27 TaxID=1268072 RepID=X4ZGI7_9BACL|nr:hypothetical protein PSAB_08000 [Paenibacillus sabinae T27]